MPRISISNRGAMTIALLVVALACLGLAACGSSSSGSPSSTSTAASAPTTTAPPPATTPASTTSASTAPASTAPASTTHGITDARRYQLAMEMVTCLRRNGATVSDPNAQGYLNLKGPSVRTAQYRSAEAKCQSLITEVLKEAEGG